MSPHSFIFMSRPSHAAPNRLHRRDAIYDARRASGAKCQPRTAARTKPPCMKFAGWLKTTLSSQSSQSSFPFHAKVGQ